ncbi:MAG: OsmC family protein, partial [Bdellovibrionaceae bacterium]|nr:OsmC family protein [Pseudobdellovibrionaceae bacterium]
MKNTLKWTGNMKFESTVGANTVSMDANPPIGSGSAQTPKELVAAGLGGCTAMDVVALLKKHKQPFESLDVDIEIEMSKGGYPAVFTKALLTFKATGAVDPKLLLEAVHLSQTKYCGVSAMLVRS